MATTFNRRTLLRGSAAATALAVSPLICTTPAAAGSARANCRAAGNF